MASLNDNLFTRLVNHATPREIGCNLLTQWGPMTARFSGEGLAELYFNNGNATKNTSDSVFRSTFLKWLELFQSMSPKEQWNYLALDGTKFQKSAWRALLTVPFGKRTSYKEIANEIGRPKATRAVGSAIGANPISVIIPCHRIIQASGAIGNYRWGSDRKLALLESEQEDGADLLRLFK